MYVVCMYYVRVQFFKNSYPTCFVLLNPSSSLFPFNMVESMNPFYTNFCKQRDSLVDSSFCIDIDSLNQGSTNGCSQDLHSSSATSVVSNTPSKFTTGGFVELCFFWQIKAPDSESRT